MWTTGFWKQVLERALKTAAQAAVLVIGGDQLFDIWNTDWKLFGGTVLVAAGLSVLTSLASTTVGEKDSPSLVETEPTE
jgi:hypothetical protein